MDVIAAARALGAAIQEDERYKKVMEQRKINDADKELQDMIGEFNMARMSIDNELTKETDRDDEKIKEFNATLRRLYGNIMRNENMIAYNKAKEDFDALMQRANAIIELCTEGEDPATCEPASGCTGSCATCAGCH